MPAIQRTMQAAARLALLALLAIFTITHAASTAHSLSSMTPADVSQWLSSLSLAQYAPLFLDNSIDGRSLASLTSEELQSLGVVALGHRKKILKAIQSLTIVTGTHFDIDNDSGNGVGAVCVMAANGESECGGSNGAWIGVRSPSEDITLNNWFEEHFPHPYDTDRCNIERIPIKSMTKTKFLSEYHLKKPFILVPDDKESAAKTLHTRDQWSRSNILRQYADIPVNLGTPHSLTAYGDGVISTTLGAYINDLRNSSIDRISADHYLFDRKGFFKQAAGLLDSYEPLSLFHWDSTGGMYGYAEAMTFGLGPTGSGINYHYHKDGWNEVLFGRKRWFLYPPTVGAPPHGYNQFEAAIAWFLKSYHLLSENELPTECMQYPGEVFYVPEDWYHATINIGETIAIVGQASEPSPNTMMWHVYAGLEAGDSKDRKASLHHFTTALSLAPNHPQVFNYIGNLYKSQDELKTAVSYYRRAVASNPQYSMAWLSLGQSLAQLQEYEGAYDALLHSHELNPQYHEVLLELGNVAYFTGQIPLAINWLEQAVMVGKEEKRTNSFINLCSMYVASNRFDDCITLAEQRLSVFDREYYIWCVYAQALSKVDRVEEAKSILHDTIKMNGGKFDPASQVLARIEDDEEMSLRRRGINEASESDREEIRGIEAKLKDIKERLQGQPAHSPATKTANANVNVRIDTGSDSDEYVSTVSIPRQLKLVTSYDLATLFPSFINKLTTTPQLITYPPLLADPTLPTFVGASKETRLRRESECRQYLEQRVISAPFVAPVWNTWMTASSGRLFGELEFHEIFANERRKSKFHFTSGNDEESVVYVGFDGLVATPTHLFAYERWCVAGTACTIEEYEAMKLATITDHNHDKQKRLLSVDSLAVLTGGVFAAQAKRILNPKEFGLGIKVDHVAKNYKLFSKQGASMPISIGRGGVSRTVDLPTALASDLEIECPSSAIVRHHYPTLIVVDQFMTGVNFAHFTTEVLPKLAIIVSSGTLDRYPESMVVIANQSWVSEALQLLGVSDNRVVYYHPCVLLSADRVVQSTPLPLDLPTKATIGVIRDVLAIPNNRGSRHHVADGSEAERRKSGATASAQQQKLALLNSTAPIVLSLFRPYPLTRSISNSAEVERALQKLFPSLPFVSFDPELYTLNEAVTLFHRAALVVGVIGAGFANVVFASLSPPPLLVQLVPTLTHHRIPCGVTPWWHYGEVIGAPSRFLTIENMGFDEANWSVPVKELVKLVKDNRQLVHLD